MGTEYRITVVAQDQISKDELEQAAVAAMESVNESMSNYLADSELSEFNRLPAGQGMLISADFAKVVAESLHIYNTTDKAFDITLGPVINLWGFGPNGSIETKPSEQELRQAKRKVGAWRISLQNRRLSKKMAGVEINLSAIAKGFAVDKVAKEFDQLGVASYLINIGGELRAKGKNAENDTWTIGIEKPRLLGGVQKTIKLADRAIATSGDYRNFVEIDGQRFSHTINPVSLEPVFHKLASVSVVSEQASTADALATALMVMGPERGKQFAQANDLAVYFLLREESGEQLSEFMSVKFKAFLH